VKIHRVSDVRQTEIHTVGLLVPVSCAFKFELFVEKPKSYKSPGINQIPAELIKAESRIIRPEIH
jgi:hypothetical protein